MILKNSLIDYTEMNLDNLYLATTNSVLVRNGLVMGAGNAKSMKMSHSEAPSVFGSMMPHMGFYGVLVHEKDGYSIGAFQTKYNWRQKSTLELIEKSTFMLAGISHFYERIHLPMPGVNHGGLNVNDVLDIIKVLPDNVIVYKK